MPIPKHHYHSPIKRGAYSFVLIFAVMSAGTTGIHWLEKMSWLDSFYFMSMIATAQGHAFEPSTATGKIFTSFMAFISVGSVVAALGFLFGPFFGKLVKVGSDKLEDELKHLRDHTKPEK